MNRTVLVIASVLALPFLSCGNDDKKTVVTPPPDETAFSLPFSSSFDEFEGRLPDRVWWAPYSQLAYYVLGWERDSAEVATGKYSLVAVREQGVRCGSPANAGKQCFATEILRTQKPIDFSSVVRAELRFMNARTVRTRVAPPSCWSGGSTIAFEVVWLDADQPPITTLPSRWNVLATFTNGTGWKEEQIDLSVLAGKKAYIGFWEPDQCVSWDSTSTLWRIDDVVVH